MGEKEGRKERREEKMKISLKSGLHTKQQHLHIPPLVIPSTPGMDDDNEWIPNKKNERERGKTRGMRARKALG